jgi:hypothetical protein
MTETQPTNIQEARRQPERFDTNKLPEKIPTVIFAKWVDFIDTSLENPTFLELLQKNDVTALHAWTFAECKRLAQEYDLAQSVKSQSRGLLDESSMPAVQFFSDTEYGNDNAWKMLRNGFFAVLIQEVTERFSTDFQESMNQVETRSQKYQILFEIKLPNGKSIAILNPESGLAIELSSSKILQASPGGLDLDEEQYPQIEQWLSVVLEKIDQYAMQHSDELLKFSRSFGYFINDEYFGSTVPFKAANFDTKEFLVILPQPSATDRAKYDVSSHQRYSVSENTEVFVSSSIGLQKSELTTITQLVVDQIFSEFAQAWAQEQAKKETPSDKMLRVIGDINLKGRTEYELQLISSSATQEGADLRSSQAIATETIIGGFGTGLFEIKNVAELEIVTQRLKKIIAEDELDILATDILERFKFSMPQFYALLISSYPEDEIAAAICSFVKAVDSGDIASARSNPILAEQFVEEGETIPRIFSTFVDYSIYEVLLRDGNDASAQQIMNKIPTRIPLLLAQLHLSLLAKLQFTTNTGVSRVQTPLDTVAVDLLTDIANRPSVAATGCPAIPGGVVTTASKIFGSFFTFLSELQPT